MLFETLIETERLLLRPEAQADCDNIYNLNADVVCWRRECFINLHGDEK
jgi:hypothetical protein